MQKIWGFRGSVKFIRFAIGDIRVLDSSVSPEGGIGARPFGARVEKMPDRYAKAFSATEFTLRDAIFFEFRKRRTPQSEFGTPPPPPWY